MVGRQLVRREVGVVVRQRRILRKLFDAFLNQRQRNVHIAHCDGGQPLSLAKQRDQNVFGISLALFVFVGLDNCQLQHLFGAGREREVSFDLEFAANPGQLLNLQPDVVNRHGQRIQNDCGIAFRQGCQAQQQMLGSDIGVVKPLGFVDRATNSALRLRCEFRVKTF